MKLLLVFAFFALVCMARSAPAPSTPSRILILPDYHDEEEIAHEQIKPDEHETGKDVEEGHDDDDDDDDDDETTTTTTTRRAPFGIPTRNRNLIPSRQPIQTQRTSSIRTTTMAVADDEEEDSTNEYNGDFKYIRDFRKYFQQLMEDIKKLVRNLTGYNFKNASQRLRNEE